MTRGQEVLGGEKYPNIAVIPQHKYDEIDQRGEGTHDHAQIGGDPRFRRGDRFMMVAFSQAEFETMMDIEDFEEQKRYAYNLGLDRGALIVEVVADPTLSGLGPEYLQSRVKVVERVKPRARE